MKQLPLLLPVVLHLVVLSDLGLCLAYHVDQPLNFFQLLRAMAVQKQPCAVAAISRRLWSWDLHFAVLREGRQILLILSTMGLVVVPSILVPLMGSRLPLGGVPVRGGISP